MDIGANVLSTVLGLKFRPVFRLASLLRFAQCCKKAKAPSYLRRASSSIARTLLARTTWTLANMDTLTRTGSLKLTISVIWHALRKEMVSSSQFYRMPSIPNKRSKPTNDATKLQCLLHGSLVKKVLQDTAIGDERNGTRMSGLYQQSLS